MSFSFGPQSEANLTGIHPNLVAIVRRAIAVSPVDFGVFEGVRTLARQKVLFAEGKTRTMNSKHFQHPDGLGWAVDLVPFINGEYSWAEWEPFYEIAAAVSNSMSGIDVTWGGVWDKLLSELPNNAAGLKAAMQAYGVRHAGSDFYDGPHFQLGRN